MASTNRTKLMDDLGRANRELYQKDMVINQYRARLVEASKKTHPRTGRRALPCGNPRHQECNQAMVAQS